VEYFIDQKNLETFHKLKTLFYGISDRLTENFNAISSN